MIIYIGEARGVVTTRRGVRRALCPGKENKKNTKERVCCLLVLNLVSSTLPCIRRPRPTIRLINYPSIFKTKTIILVYLPYKSHRLVQFVLSVQRLHQLYHIPPPLEDDVWEELPGFFFMYVCSMHARRHPRPHVIEVIISNDVSFSPSLSLTHCLSLSCFPLSHTHTLSLSHTHSLCLSLPCFPLSHTHSHTPSLYLLSLSLIPVIVIPLCLIQTHKHTHIPDVVLPKNTSDLSSWQEITLREGQEDSIPLHAPFAPYPKFQVNIQTQNHSLTHSHLLTLLYALTQRHTHTLSLYALPQRTHTHTHTHTQLHTRK